MSARQVLGGALVAVVISSLLIAMAIEMGVIATVAIVVASCVLVWLLITGIDLMVDD